MRIPDTESSDRLPAASPERIDPDEVKETVMHTRHLEIIAETTDGAGPAPSSTWRDMVLASVVLGILFLGIAGGAVAPDSSAELLIADAQASTPAGQPQHDFV